MFGKYLGLVSDNIFLFVVNAQASRGVHLVGSISMERI